MTTLGGNDTRTVMTSKEFHFYSIVVSIIRTGIMYALLRTRI